VVLDPLPRNVRHRRQVRGVARRFVRTGDDLHYLHRTFPIRMPWGEGIGTEGIFSSQFLLRNSKHAPRRPGRRSNRTVPAICGVILRRAGHTSPVPGVEPRRYGCVARHADTAPVGGSRSPLIRPRMPAKTALGSAGLCHLKDRVAAMAHQPRAGLDQALAKLHSLWRLSPLLAMKRSEPPPKARPLMPQQQTCQSQIPLSCDLVRVMSRSVSLGGGAGKKMVRAEARP
jgi:hypothetical protein